jgi:hypothetical protein
MECVTHIAPPERLAPGRCPIRIFLFVEMERFCSVEWNDFVL